MTLLFGKPIADQILADTSARIEATHIVPGLAVILIGDDTSSHLYVNLKEKAARKIGMHFEKHLFTTNVSREEIFTYIDKLNTRKDIHGIIVQLPLPTGFPTDDIIAHIDPTKDADGFHPETIRQFLAGDDTLCPVFPRAMRTLLRLTGEQYDGDKGLVIANSELLGKVMQQTLAQEGLMTEYILSTTNTQTLLEKTKQARVIFTACGIPGFITGAMISEGTIIIDGGISADAGRVVGDVDRVSVDMKAAFLSPVPGGIGPVTVATLLARVTEL
ncbi:MAG TPA: bifunctional 5,10-methylenetetrahydrofolate dehydrogenase/5,10-methenyltetrahydrofolate cyclohydrolase, partial [Patescibacteria group bacterium]|nr:bifunctional 5,10-methylenetetrahydrofolate dehydrogenase/5,10-methenyltetrahydrofolate cyclohydrolase [Patescibacteria group bacterium]